MHDGPPISDMIRVPSTLLALAAAETHVHVMRKRSTDIVTRAANVIYIIKGTSPSRELETHTSADR